MPFLGTTEEAWNISTIGLVRFLAEGTGRLHVSWLVHLRSRPPGLRRYPLKATDVEEVSRTTELLR